MANTLSKSPSLGLSSLSLSGAFGVDPEAAPDFMTATGGTITTDGDYKVHTFNSSGTFTPENAVDIGR